MNPAELRISATASMHPAEQWWRTSPGLRDAETSEVADTRLCFDAPGRAMVPIVVRASRWRDEGDGALGRAAYTNSTRRFVSAFNARIMGLRAAPAVDPASAVRHGRLLAGPCPAGGVVYPARVSRTTARRPGLAAPK
jgi:hypothetical protein